MRGRGRAQAWGAVGAAALAVALVGATWWLRNDHPPVDLAMHIDAAEDRAPAAAPVDAVLAVGAGDRVAAVQAEFAAAASPAAAPVSDVEVFRLVEDLRDDHVAKNAERAIPRLVCLPAGSVHALETALVSFDVQQRHLAARVLRRRAEQYGDGSSQQLLEVTVEGLGAGLAEQLALRQLCMAWDPPADCTRFLAGRAPMAVEPLRRAVAYGDAQQRFLAAWLLAAAGEERDAAAICRELLPHLAHNDVQGDAVMAANGLLRLGDAALPTLRAWRPWVDEQARSLIDLIERDVSEPPVTLDMLAERGRMHRVTHVYQDPAVQFDLTRSRVPQLAAR